VGAGGGDPFVAMLALGLLSHACVFGILIRGWRLGSGTGPAIVGWSKGGIASPVPDPGSVDVSSSMPLFTNGPDNFALKHVVAAARLGSMLALAVDRVEALAPFAFLIVGDVEHTAGQTLLGVGAPGCSVFANTLAAAAVPVSGATGSGAFVIGIVVATLSAAVAIKWLVGFLNTHGLSPFGWYRLVLCAVLGGLILGGVVRIEPPVEEEVSLEQEVSALPSPGLQWMEQGSTDETPD